MVSGQIPVAASDLKHAHRAVVDSVKEESVVVPQRLSQQIIGGGHRCRSVMFSADLQTEDAGA